MSRERPKKGNKKMRLRGIEPPHAAPEATALSLSLIHIFMEAVYSEDFDVSEVLETVFEKGMNHRLHFFMALSPREYEELAGYRAIRQFGDWKQGIDVYKRQQPLKKLHQTPGLYSVPA